MEFEKITDMENLTLGDENHIEKMSEGEGDPYDIEDLKVVAESLLLSDDEMVNLENISHILPEDLSEDEEQKSLIKSSGWCMEHVCQGNKSSFNCMGAI